MSKKKGSRDYRDGYDSFDRPDIMDRIGDSFTSVFSRRSRENEKADDVLSELDPKRQDFVLNQITSGQVFITCCEPDRFTKLGQTIHIEQGSVI